MNFFCWGAGVSGPLQGGASIIDPDDQRVTAKYVQFDCEAVGGVTTGGISDLGSSFGLLAVQPPVGSHKRWLSASLRGTWARHRSLGERPAVVDVDEAGQQSELGHEPREASFGHGGAGTRISRSIRFRTSFSIKPDKR